MSGNNSGNSQPWFVAIVVAVISATSGIFVAIVNKPQSPSLPTLLTESPTPYSTSTLEPPSPEIGNLSTKSLYPIPQGDKSNITVGNENQIVTGNNNSVIRNTTINKADPTDLPPPPDVDENTPVISPNINEHEQYCEYENAWVIVAEYVKDEFTTDLLPTTLQDKNNIRQTYYLVTENLSMVEHRSLSAIFVPGRRLKIKYKTCGNGGRKFVYYAEALRGDWTSYLRRF
jgi:hypothetical protein